MSAFANVFIEPPIFLSSASHRSRSLRRTVVLSAVVALAALAYVSLNKSHQPIATAPDLSFTTTLGGKFALADLRGKVVIVNFWATSCSICVAEMPRMVEVFEDFRDRKLEFVAIAMPYDPPNLVLDYAQSRRLPFKVTIDSTGKAVRAFGGIGQTPTTFVIGKSGRVVRRFLGEPDFAELRRVVATELAG